MAKQKKQDLTFPSPKEKATTPKVDFLSELDTEFQTLAFDEKARLSKVKNLTDCAETDKIKR